MTTDIDAKLIEQGRKLFAGDWQFFWASPSIETLPPMAGIADKSTQSAQRRHAMPGHDEERKAFA